MAKVRMLVTLAGSNGVWDAGDTYECDDAEAGRLVAAGFAERMQPVKPKTESRPSRKPVESREA